MRVPGKAAKVIDAAEARGINLRFVDADTVGVSIDETTTAATLVRAWPSPLVPAR